MPKPIKLNEQYVIERYYQLNTLGKVAIEFGVCNETIRRILIRNNVPRVSKKPKAKPKSAYCGNRKFCHALVKMLFEAGYSYYDIAQIAKCSIASVSVICGERRKEITHKIVDELIALYEAGESCYSLENKFGIGRTKILELIRSNGGHTRVRNRFSEEQKHAMQTLFKDGKSVKDIALMVGCNEVTVTRTLRKEGIDYSQHSVFVDRLNNLSENIKYIEGNTKRGITFRCLNCGNEFIKKGHDFSNLSCPICREEKRKRAIEEKRKRANARLDEKLTCAWCGKEFTEREILGDYTDGMVLKRRHHFCSHKCKRKAAQQDIRIEHRSKRLSWQKVMKRDGCLCAICGEPVDVNDFTITSDGYYIVGAKYPSVDHIIPLSKGGSHSYENAQLAHCLCNSLKSDSLEVIA